LINNVSYEIEQLCLKFKKKEKNKIATNENAWMMSSPLFI